MLFNDLLLQRIIYLKKEFLLNFLFNYSAMKFVAYQISYDHA